MSSLRTFHLVTLGCKINQYESQALREAWIAASRVETQDPAAAADILVNSCAVTARAVRDLRQTVAKLRRASPGARIVLTGCAAQVLAEELRAWPEVDRVVSQAAKPSLLDPDRVAVDEDAAGFPAFAIRGFERARAVVKVQDGCSQRCAYCVVPLTRGPARSREPAAVLDELRRLFDNGAAECVLSGINLNNYGRGLSSDATLEGWPIRDFWDLLAALDRALAPAWEGRGRLRVSSLDPAQLDAKGLDTLAAARLVCPHLHLALQSGSPEILRRMNRSQYAGASIRMFMDAYAALHPVYGLGVDLLVGFPGETERHFEETRDLCAALDISYAHVFPYSLRPGTPAAGLPGQVPVAEKKQRAARLRSLASEKKVAFLRRLEGLERLDIALEGRSPSRGRCEYYAECVLDREAPADVSVGDLLTVKPLRTTDGGLLASPMGGER